MSLVAAVVIGALAASAPPPMACPGCTLDAPPDGQARSLLVVLQDEGELRPWRRPALDAGWAVLSLAGWEDAEPSWIEDQVFAAARQQPIDLSRVYLIGNGDGASYIAGHIQELSQTFAAVAITGGGGRPPLAACPDETLPAYFQVDAGDRDAAALRAYLERCKQPVVWSTSPSAFDRRVAAAILDWMHQYVRVTTVAW